MGAPHMLLIINPQAKHGVTEGLAPAIEQLLRTTAHDTVWTKSAGHAAEIAEERGSDYEIVVAAGGDGTVHEVLNGLMRLPRESRPVLGVLPTGSGNDTRRTLSIPDDLARAALVLVTGERKSFDVGSVNGIYFNNSFAAGLDAKVTAKAVEYKVTTKRSGLWLYLTALMHVLFNDMDSHEVRVSFDRSPATTVRTLIVAVTQGPTYGGGFYITPDADATDGLFDVCMIDPLTLPQALVRLPFVVFGKHTNMKVVHMSRHTNIVIESDVPLPAQVDGEVLLESRYEVRMHAGAIDCMVPRSTR